MVVVQMRPTTSFTAAASTPISPIASIGQRRKVRPRFAATSSVKPISMTTARSFPFATQTK